MILLVNIPPNSLLVHFITNIIIFHVLTQMIIHPQGHSFPPLPLCELKVPYHPPTVAVVSIVSS